MICPNCHADNKPGASFCTYCGTKLEHTAHSASHTPASGGDFARQAQNIWRRLNKRNLAIAGGVLLLVVVALVFLFREPKTVNLDKYVDVEFIGVNGNGEAHVVLRSDQLAKDHKRKFDKMMKMGMDVIGGGLLSELGSQFGGLSGSALSGLKNMDKETIRTLMAQGMMEEVKVTVDPKKDLQNGQQVLLKMDVDKDIIQAFQLFGFRVKFTPHQLIKVKGLQ